MLPLRQPAETKPPARQLLLGAAARLFYSHGVGATGIDAVTAAAGVAKKSLYNNFGSKSDLVAAYLEARHEEWLDLYRARLSAAPGPRERVLAIFDAYLDHANFAYEQGFRGCGLLNAAAELPVGSSGREAVRQHKEEVAALLAGHLAEMLPGQGDRVAGLAAHLAFLLEGAMVRAGLEGSDALLLEGRAIAANLLAEL